MPITNINQIVNGHYGGGWSFLVKLYEVLNYNNIASYRNPRFVEHFDLFFGEDEEAN